MLSSLTTKYSFDKLEYLKQEPNGLDEFGNPVYSSTWIEFKGRVEEHEEKKTIGSDNQEISYSNTLITTQSFDENIEYKIRINEGIEKIVKKIEIISDRKGNKFYYLLF